MGRKEQNFQEFKKAMWQQYQYKDASGDHPYFVYTPTTYHLGTAVPLLVLLHGCTQTAADYAAGTGMNELAEQYGFIVLYPQQTRSANRTVPGRKSWPPGLRFRGPSGRRNC